MEYRNILDWLGNWWMLGMSTPWNSCSYMNISAPGFGLCAFL
jgi:hypothetical protein